MPRPKTPRLNHDMIVDKALEMVATPAGLTMPGLAKQLNVSVSSVYHYVPSRTHLLELIRNRIAALQLDEVDWDADWRAVLVEWVRAYRLAFAPYPELVALLTAQTITDAKVLDVYDRIAGVIGRAGIATADILSVITVLDNYALGSALDRAAPDVVWSVEGATRPHLSAAVAGTQSGVARADEAFEYGLQILIDGLAARLTARTGDETSTGNR